MKRFVIDSHNLGKLWSWLRKMKPGGGSALFDAIYKACTNRNLVQGEPYEPRRVIIVVGDGHEPSTAVGAREAP